MAQRRQLSGRASRRFFSAHASTPSTRKSVTVQYVMRGGIRF